MRAVLIALAVVATVVHCLRFRDFTVDDAAISFAYSQNFAHGDGLVPTAHGERVEGYSNFLWVILVGIFVVPFGHVMVIGKALGAALAVAITIGCAELVAALRRRRSTLDALPSLLCASFLPISYWSMSGLENPLYLALTVWGCVFSLREGADVTRRPWSALFFAGLALTRPDGLVVAVAGAVAQLFTRHQARRFPLWIALAAAPIALHIAWRYSYYAYPWPNTYYVKVAFPFKLREIFEFHSNGWKYIFSFCDRYRLATTLIIALLAFVNRDLRSRLVLLGVLAAVVFFPIYARGDWMSEGRFIVGAMPLVFVLATDGIANIAEVVRRGYARVPVALIGVAPAAAVVLTLVPRSIALSNERVHHYPVPVEGVAERARRYHQLATRLDVESPSVADGDAGGNLLYAGMPVVDIGWLNDTTLAHWGRNPGFTREYIYNERKPTFLRLTGYWLETHLQDYSEFAEYVNAPNDGDGLYVARSAFTVEGIDTRAPLAHLSDAIDLIGYNANATTFTAWVLARRDKVAAQLFLRVPGREVAINPGEGIYLPAVWRAGEVVKISGRRPDGAALHFCADEACVSIEDGQHGAAPLQSPKPSEDDIRLLVERGEWEAAAAAKRARHEPADKIGQQLFGRAEMELAANQTSAAFDDFQAALRARPSLALARRRSEELRTAPRRGYHPIVGLRLSAAIREFHLSATADNLARVVNLASAARDPVRAVRAHLATKVTPSDVTQLAECYLEAGLPQQAAQLIAAATPHGEAELATFDRIVLAAGRRDLFDRWNHAPTKARQLGSGLDLTEVTGTLSSSGDTILVMTVSSADAKPTVAVKIDGYVISLGDQWIAGERRRRAVWLGARAGSTEVAVGDAHLTVTSQPFSADFERGSTQGWTAEGVAFEAQPRTQSFHEAFGTQGNEYVYSKEWGDGRLTSEPLAAAVVDVCFDMGGSSTSGVALDRNGEVVAKAQPAREVAASRCLMKTGGGGDWQVIVEDADAQSRVVFDDLVCFARSGGVTPCSGTVSVTF